MSQRNKILVVEDSPDDALLLKRYLVKTGYDVEVASSLKEALPQAQSQQFDAVITDLDLKVPGASGLELISQLRQAMPHLPVILLTGYHSPLAAIEATRLGAYDYMPKPFSWDDARSLEELSDMVEKAVASKELMDKRVEIGEASPTEDAIIGKCSAMQEVYKEIGRVAATPLTVLIRGETGTGKELVARAIYSHSNRDQQPFVVVNCAAIPESLLESELFGHERGAFTGATVRRLGRFEQADGGTIFLDEIGDMNVNLQQKMLRVLQEKTIERVGGKEPVTVNVRVIAATHRDLEQAVREGAFRQDLYFRLNVAVILLPPLRERAEDIPDLLSYFLRRYGAQLGSSNPALSADQQQPIWDYLQSQPWSGNIRELRNVARKALLLSRGFDIDLETVRLAVEQMQPPRPASDQSFAAYVARVLASAATGDRENVLALLTEEIRRELYAQAIRKAEGDQTKAARWLGISRPTIRERLLKFGLHPAQEQP